MERLRYNTGFYEVFHTKNKEEQYKIKEKWGDVMFYQIYKQSIFPLSKVMCLLSLHSILIYQQCIGYTAWVNLYCIEEHWKRKRVGVHAFKILIFKTRFKQIPVKIVSGSWKP